MMIDSSGGGLSDLDDINDLEMIMEEVQSEQEQEAAVEWVRHRNYIYRKRLDAKERLMADYFGPNPKYPLYYFRKLYRMSRKLFLEIVLGIENYIQTHHPLPPRFDFFRVRPDATGLPGFSVIMKCTCAIRQLAYGVTRDALDEYLQMEYGKSVRCSNASNSVDLHWPALLHRKVALLNAIGLGVGKAIEYHEWLLQQESQPRLTRTPIFRDREDAERRLRADYFDDHCKHAKLSFYNSKSSIDFVFEIIHSDIWTSPIPSENGIKYYAIFLDYFSHFVWVYPLHKKSDLFDNFVAFRTYVNKQCTVDIKALQCDHGGEYDDTRFHELFGQYGIQLWFSCPRTSQQNGKSERMLRTINNLISTLLFQAYIPSSYWVKALNMAAYLLNILPSTAINNEISFTKLYNQIPTYEDLRVFGCLCYPHVDASRKLEPRFTPCIFLGYPANHRGYRCLDLASNKIIISRHVRFDEDVFPFENVTSSNTPTYDFLLPSIQPQPMFPPRNHLSNTWMNQTTQLRLITQPLQPAHHKPIPLHLIAQHQSYHNSILLHLISTPIPTLAQTQSHAQTVDSHTLILINNSSQTMTTHPMVTRAKASIFKPLKHEYNALISNGTWVLVPRPANVNVVRSMWLFKHKFKADGSLSMYKARLVANERSQQHGIDCDETFSLVVKPPTIRIVLSLAVSHDWSIHQLDVNAFLHGHLFETVYMHQPPGFVDPNKPGYVCHLQRSLYGLKQALRAWFQRFASYATRRIIASLQSEFAMTDLGSLNYFFGISAQRSASGLFLSQSKFAEEILERAHMHNCNPCRTLVDAESKLGSDGDPVSDPTLYRSLAGFLQYLTFTRPDLSYAVQQVCLHMHDLRDPHFTALKRILRYIRGTVDYGLQLHVSSTTQLSAYTDVDWVGCPVTRRSTSGYCEFLDDNLLSWFAKRKVTLSRTSAEAEYRGVANVVTETAWIHNLLCELHTPLFTATLVYCDNVSAVYMSANPVQHQRTKHIEIDIHFVRDFVASDNESCKYVHAAQTNSGSNSRAFDIAGNGSSNNNTMNDHFLMLLDTIKDTFDLHPTVLNPTLPTLTIGQTDLLPHQQHPTKPIAHQSPTAAPPTPDPLPHQQHLTEPVAQQSLTAAPPTPASPSSAQIYSSVQQPSSMAQHTPVQLQTNRPTERLNLHVSLVSPLPKSYRDAFNYSNWQNVIRDEYTALVKNKSWTLVPRPTDTNSVRCMWLIRYKYLADGTLSRYKARLVANGSTQLEGVDVDETFSPVVKPGTIQTVLNLAASRY
nr:ribonuclease H-like domain-containing protein [Tanacetum cinerariifolium]